LERCWNIGLSLLFAAGAFAQTQEPLVLLTEPWPPYIVQNEKGEFSGVHTEIILAAFKEMKREVRIEAYPWKRCLAMIEDRQGDAIFTLNKNPERERFLFFPVQPVAESPSVFFVLKTNIGRVKYESFKDLAGLTIGVTNGKEYEGGLLQQKDLTFDVAVKDEMNIAKLGTGRIDLWPSDMYVGYELINQVESGKYKGQITHLPKYLNNSHVYLGFARKPGYDKLAKQFNSALTKIQRSGAYKAIVTKYTK
jgi:polar amino acid transport system substrate-binding protein